MFQILSLFIDSHLLFSAFSLTLNSLAIRLRKVYDADWLSLMLRGLNLKDVEYFSKSDPFYELRTQIGKKWYVSIF